MLFCRALDSNVWHLWSLAMFALLSLYLWPISIFFAETAQASPKKLPQNIFSRRGCLGVMSLLKAQKSEDWDQMVTGRDPKKTFKMLVLSQTSLVWIITVDLNNFALIHSKAEIREAYMYQLCSFFKHCLNGLWPPPPSLVLNMYVANFFERLLKKCVNACHDKIQKNNA